jgi:uncharacterized coiled-coil protein SlyX
MERVIRRFRSAWVFVVVVIALSFTVLTAAGQSQAPSTDDLTRAFITELRLLRVAVENLASANSRVQLLSMRAARQEQRLATLSDQLVAMRMKLAEISAEATARAAHIERLQESLRVETDPEKRGELEVMNRDLKETLTGARLKQAAMQAEVDLLMQQAYAEQSRLADTQQRLDDVERALAQPRQ